MMACVQSKKEGVILKNNLPKNNGISMVAGEILLKKDSDFDIFCFHINADGYLRHVFVFGLKIIRQLPHPRLMFCLLLAALTFNNFC